MVSNIRSRARLVFPAILLGILAQWALSVARPPDGPGWIVFAGADRSWLIGLLLFLAAALCIGISLSAVAGTRKPACWPLWADLAALVLVTLIATAARLYRIEQVPAGLWLDETDIARQALDILRGARPLPWAVARLEVPWLNHYVVALAYRLISNSYLAIKAPWLLASILTAPLLYLLARQMFDPPPALAGALLWSTLRWSINISRWGHVNTLTPFWFCLEALLLWRAAKSGKRIWWIGAGAALGLSQYGYQASRALLPLALFFLIYLIVSRRKEWTGRQRLLDLGALLAAFALCVAPLLLYYVGHLEQFTERTTSISIFNPLFTRDPWAKLIQNIGRYAGAFHFVGDPNGRHNIPGAPMLDPISGVLLVLGLGVLLRRPLQRHSFLLLCWLGLFMAAGILTTEAPNTFRIYGITPAVCLAGAAALQYLYDLLHRRAALTPAPGWLPAASGGGILLIALAAGGLNVTTFFQQQALHPGVIGTFNMGPTQVGQYIASLPPDVALYIDREFWPSLSPVEILNPERAFIRLESPEQIPPAPGSRGASAYILGIYGSERYAPYLAGLYPEASVQEGYSPAGERLFMGLLVPATTQEQRGLRGRWHAEVEAIGDSIHTAISAPTEPPVSLPAHGILEGGLYLPACGAYSFRVQGALGARLELAGQTVLSEADEEGSLLLPAGLVPVRLEWTLLADGQAALLWRAGDAGEWTSIPADAWYPIPTETGGLLGLFYEGGGYRMAPVRIIHDPVLYADNAGDMAASAARWIGRLRIDQAGIYSFNLASDDGARLWIDNQLVVDAWGIHATNHIDGTAELSAGLHRIHIDYVDGGGGYWFEVRWTPPGREAAPLPAEVLSWTQDDLRAALQPPEQPTPGLRVAGSDALIPLENWSLGDDKWGQPVGDANFQGWPLKVAEKLYDRGIGIYGPSELSVELAGRFVRLQGQAGIDNDTYGDSVTLLQILGDGRLLWESGARRTFDPPVAFDLDLTGVHTLVLRQDDASVGEGRGDAADWLDLTLQPAAP